MLALAAGFAASAVSAQMSEHAVPDAAQDHPSAAYAQVQARLARGWNTWDVNSMTTHVLLPEGLAIHIGFKHNTTLNGDEFLQRTSVDPGTAVPGLHAWDGSYTQLTVTWKGHAWRVESAHEGSDLVLLVTPLDPPGKFALPPTAVFGVDFLWGRAGTALRRSTFIETHGSGGLVRVYCTCPAAPPTQDPVHPGRGQLPVSGAYFAADLTKPAGVSTGEPRSVAVISAILDRQRAAYRKSTGSDARIAPIVDAIETTLGWDAIYDPEKQRVFSPVSRDWSIGWGGYVLFDWDTFFAATLSGIGDKDLAYANALETLHEETPAGFVPNYARAGGWKSFDRSEPPVGAITVLALYRKFHDRWFLDQAFPALLRWNRWWTAHRDLQGYLTWGSDPENQPRNPDDTSVGTWQGAIFESGLDNSPMYDGTVYNPHTHLLEYADVGLMGMYVADCDALAQIADVLERQPEARNLRMRAQRYRAKLQSMWDPEAGIFLNIDRRTGEKVRRLSPTNFYPLLARAATPQQAHVMVEKHLMNPREFWGQYVMPSIARDDLAFKDQNYWRGRIWGPMNYLVYLGLRNYDLPDTRRDFAAKSYALFLKEWPEKRHVHENYNAITGTGDDVLSSDRFYHWGALLGYVEFLQRTGAQP